MKASTTISFEIELAITGQFSPARPATGPSYSSGGDPPEDASVDDVTVEGVGAVLRVPVNPDDPRPGRHMKWVTKSALDGVNLASPEVQRLLANLLELAGGGVDELVAEAGE